MLCKTIILSNSQNLSSNAPKGILTLTNQNNLVTGKIRLYNLTLPQTTKIGLYIDEKVHIFNLIKKPNHYEFALDVKVDISKSVYCALIDTANNKQVLLEGGSFNGFYFTDSPFDAVLEAKDEQLEQEITNALKSDDKCCCDCANCEYKKYFYDNYNTIQADKVQLDANNLDNEDIAYSNKDLFTEPKTNTTVNPINDFQEQVIENMENGIIENVEDIVESITPSSEVLHLSKNENTYDNIKNETDNANKNTPSNQIDTSASQEKLEFLNEIIYQLDEMFTQYPQDELLNSIISNSRFIRVDGDNPYVLGVIYEDKIMKYIAYGVPAEYNSLPPADFGNHYQWLPLNPRDVMSDGYFMIYQDASNGNLVEINFEE